MLNKEKGITLIALIITIIVMLILVGVTINVALNGGLFTKAEQAKIQTQLAVDREELQMAVISALNDDREIPNKQAIKNNLQEGWEVTGNDGGPYTCTSPNGNVFTADKKGNIKEGETNSGGGNEPIAFDWGLNVDSKADYIYEPAEGMKYVMNFTDAGTIKIKYNEKAEQVVEEKDIIKLENDEEGYKIQFHMNLSNGTESLVSDVKLKNDTNNEDIIVYIVVNGEMPTFIKYEPVDLSKDRVYGPFPSMNGYIVLNPENEIILVAEGQIISRKSLVIYNGSITKLIEAYPKYEVYPIEGEVYGFNKFILADEELTGALDETEYKFYFAGVSNETIQIGEYARLNPNLELEDLVQ